MWLKSSCPPPSGLTVAHTVVRVGIPPTLASPAFFQFAYASSYDGNTPVVGSLADGGLGGAVGGGGGAAAALPFTVTIADFVVPNDAPWATARATAMVFEPVKVVVLSRGIENVLEEASPLPQPITPFTAV